MEEVVDRPLVVKIDPGIESRLQFLVDGFFWERRSRASD
jgi:hypothetical protein